MNLREVSDSLMLTIEQISHICGVPKSTLRYWEKSFHSCLKPSRSQSNRREYSLEDLERVRTIKRLLEEEHLTTTGVRLRLGELFPAILEGAWRRPASAEAVGGSPAP